MLKSKYASYYDETVARCRKCNLKGFLPAGDGYTACPCFLEYAWLRKLHDSGLPKLYWKIPMDKFIGDPKAFAAVQEYINVLPKNLELGTGLYLYGDPGIGKTLLASYILQAGLRLGKSCTFYTFNSLLTTFTDAWRNKDAQEEVESNVLNSDLLVLDDLGREFKSNKNLHESILDTVLRTRAGNMKPIILTSNFDRYDVKDTYGAIIIDLFKESLKAVHVTGESRRGQHDPA
jgi:DNA replication protein DnaC